ncbi:DUF4041 domain-containing protein [Methylobacterium currus]|uniref:DUF4041 domain-containing protein n=1 Tax=Methylobacterium currus TaxID=2051553 RepID=UPI001E2B8631|nr:DUF4041 domain-containing protein [Methylobacterium currus]UHC17321.1 DUF4041 domain-containing protein [Methylobacterium currus]
MQVELVAIIAVMVALTLMAIIATVLLVLLIKQRRVTAQKLKRFSGVIDAEAELERVRAGAAQQQADADAELERARAETAKRRAEAEELATKYRLVEQRYNNVASAEDIIANLGKQAVQIGLDIERTRAEYKEKRSVYDRLLKEVAIFDERLSFAEMGVYEPHFDFADSEQYKAQIEDARNEQKIMISAGTAVICSIQWTVDGSEAKGRTMTNRAIKLTLRAFNGECDAAIANTRWNNVNAMEKRISRAKDQINKLNESNRVLINDAYAALKFKELLLTHELREKLKAEKDERAEAARASREEQKLFRDIEAAEEAEARYQRLLAKATADAAKASGANLEALTGQIRMLESDLADAHAKVERAQALAERTRSGYVYIISNVGSFGKDVVKIGLTRRLDPLDRVRELGDASVPFTFDTHAIIYSEDAPALERSLHAEFERTRVNAQNCRKEFFRASIDEVEVAVKRLAPAAPFIKDVEAQEYQETLARRHQALSAAGVTPALELPAAI